MNKDQIKSIRKELGITQKELAQFLGVSIKTVQGWELGTSKPNSNIIELFQKTKELEKENLELKKFKDNICQIIKNELEQTSI